MTISNKINSLRFSDGGGPGIGPCQSGWGKEKKQKQRQVSGLCHFGVVDCGAQAMTVFVFSVASLPVPVSKSACTKMALDTITP